MTKDPLDNIDIDPRAIDLSDRITFGKYSGRTLIRVIDSDPEYVSWCLKNVVFFVISKEAARRHLEKLAKLLMEDEEDHDEGRDDGDIPF